MLTPKEKRLIRIKNLRTGMFGKKHSKETKEKIRMTAVGRMPSKANRKAVAESNKIRGCSKETREKMRKKKLGRPGGMLGKKVSQETKNLISSMLKERACRGKNHPNWRGGITPIKKQIKRLGEYRQWRNAIFKRDDWTCQNCNKRGIELNPHHIKAFSVILRENKIRTIKEAINCRELWEINNGIALCKKCHKLTPTYGNFKIIQEFPG